MKLFKKMIIMIIDRHKQTPSIISAPNIDEYGLLTKQYNRLLTFNLYRDRDSFDLENYRSLFCQTSSYIDDVTI